MSNNTDSQLTVINWNARSLANKISEIMQFADENNADILTIQESWLTREKTLKAPNYQAYRFDNTDIYGRRGLVTLVRDTFPSKKVPLGFINNTEVELMAVEVTLANRSILIVNIYVPPGLRLPRIFWDNVFDQSLHPHVILCGDLNAHHPLWGSGDTDLRGQQIFDSMLDSPLILIENDGETRISRPGHNKSATDAAFSSASLFSNLTIQILNETAGSDHFLMKIVLQNAEKIPIIPIFKWNFKKADWQKFDHIIFQKLSSTQFDEITNVNFQQYYDLWESTILEAATEAIPQKQINSRTKSNLWWNETCEEVTNNKRQAISTWRRSKTLINYQSMKQATQHARATIFSVKRSAWRDLCQQLSTTSQPISAWNMLSIMNGNRSRTKFVKPETEPQLCSTVLSSITRPCPLLTQMPLDPQTAPHPFTLTQLEHALARRVKDTCPGEDKISYSMLKRMPLMAKSLLLKMYNFCYQSNSMPSQWLKIKIIYVKKHTAPDSNSSAPPSIRPLSLISCPVKILNSMIGQQLESHVESNFNLPTTQHGFRKRRSCLNCLSEMYLRILAGRDEHLTTMCCFLDITGAFNAVKIEELVHTMKLAGISPFTTAWVQKFFSSKTYTDGVNSSYGSQGLDQGSVLSPLLFNLYVHVLHNLNFSPGTTVLSYADDFALLVQSKDVLLNLTNMRSNLETLLQTFAKLGLQINVNKTKILSFFDGLSDHQRLDLTINLASHAEPICTVKTTKYLGIMLDDRLRGQCHTKSVIDRCNNDVRALKSMKGSGWGNHPEVQEALYKFAILPKIFYGAHLYCWGLKANFDKLQILQNTALRQILGAVKSSPIPSLHSLTSTPYLDVQLHFETTRTWCRLIIYDTNIRNSVNRFISPPHQRNLMPWNRYREILHEITTIMHDEDVHLNSEEENSYRHHPSNSLQVCPTIPTVDKKTNFNPHQLQALVAEHIELKYPPEYSGDRLFTDGSKLGSGATSSADYRESDNTANGLKVNNSCSVFNAELIAIDLALKRMYDDPHSLNDAVVLSDSRSALQSLHQLKSGDNPPYIIQSIIKSVNNLKRDRAANIQFQWIAGHSFIKGNEIADNTAKLIASQPDPPHKHGLVTYPDLVRQLKLKKNENWIQQHTLKTEAVGHWTKSIIPDPTVQPWYCNITASNPKFFSTVNRIIIGHGNTPFFQHLMAKRATPYCLNCPNEQVADVDHLLNFCTASIAARRSLYQQLGIEIGTSIQDHLRYPFKQEDLNIIFSYVESISDGGRPAI
uniref:RNA-directed DNA polymerase from mobile element jockey n=1 Tax=Lygus hesperus TaxID=30085 RepID=A0A0A9Z1X7_LYGHE